MKVILITGSAPPQYCGVGDYTYHLGKELSKVHDVTIITSYGAKDIIEPNFKVLPIIKSWSARHSFWMFRKLHELKPDVLHIQYPTQGYTGWLAYLFPFLAFLLGIKVVQTWHEIYTKTDFNHLLAHGWIPGGVVIVRPQFFELTTPFVRFLAKNKKVEFIPNGSAIPQSRLNLDEINAKRAKLLGDQKRLLTFFGFVYDHKGVETIFEVADPKRDQILIAGHLDPQNTYHQKILKLTESTEWKNKVHLLGFLEANDVADYLRCSDLAIFPLKGGAGEWNTSLHAAVKNGCPFVATTITEPLKKGDSYFVPANDLKAMKAAIDKVMTETPFEVRQINNAIPKNEWDDIARKHSELYSSIS